MAQRHESTQRQGLTPSRTRLSGWKWRRSQRGPGRRAPARAAALVVGALPALAFPAASWWWLAWVGVVPLLLVVRAAPDGARGWCAGVVGSWRVRAGHAVLAAAHRRSAASGAGRRVRRVVAAVGVGRAMAVVGPGQDPPEPCRRDRVAQRVGDGRGGAVLAESGRPVGVAGRVPVESARYAGVGLARRRVADKFPARRGEHRDRRRDPAPGCVRSGRSAGGSGGVRRIRPGLVRAGIGASGRFDATGGSGAAGRHRRLRGPSGGQRSAHRNPGRPAARPGRLGREQRRGRSHQPSGRDDPPRGPVPAGRRGPARQRRRTRPDRGNRQVIRSHRTERITAGHTRNSGWSRSASTFPCDHCLAGSPGTPRPQPRTGGAAADWSCCTPARSASGR